jgi:hypothetical protein
MELLFHATERQGVVGGGRALNILCGERFGSVLDFSRSRFHRFTGPCFERLPAL